VRLGLEELNLGEEAILLGKIGEAGASEPFSCCYILCQLRTNISSCDFIVTESGSLDIYI